MTYYLNIGTNLGDRAENITNAIAHLERQLKVICNRSEVIETQAWGFNSDNMFWNIGVAFDSEIKPEVLLDVIHEIEHTMGVKSHRTATGEYADRVIDIDIVAIDEMIVSTETLKVPHPHLAQRLFYLKPLAELAPTWRHPVTQLTVSQMLQLQNERNN